MRMGDAGSLSGVFQDTNLLSFYIYFVSLMSSKLLCLQSPEF